MSTPNGSTTEDLPIILCLHGGGSTPVVFKIQSRRLLWTLGTQFKFIFAQGPHIGPPGFGMLPVFESCAPFYRWVSRRMVLGEGETEGTPMEEANLADESLDECVEQEGGWGRVVGCMGFSQGARLVPGLLLRQETCKRDGKECKWDFKFGIMVGGPYPPICLHRENDEEVDVRDYELLRTVATVHAWGRDDHVKEGCQKMREMCEGDVCFQMDFEGTHHMPLKDVEAKDLCDLILAAWYAGGGSYGVAKGQKY